MNRIFRAISLWAAAVVLAIGLATPAEAQTDTRYATATVRLRAAPGTGARILTTIPRRSAVAVGTCADDWCEVRYRGRSGYAAERYLSDDQPTRTVRSSRGGGGGDGYINSRGEWVPSPAYSPNGPPACASALCRDGTYSFSRSRRGTCSHHGGVARWL